MVDPSPIDPDRQLEELCRVLNDFGVRYVVFGGQVARSTGTPFERLANDELATYLSAAVAQLRLGDLPALGARRSTGIT